MPAIGYGYLSIYTAALALMDKVNFSTTIANQGLYTQGGTPVVTDFVAFTSDKLPKDATITGVSCRMNYTGTPGTKSTISVFKIDAISGTITSLVTPLLDTGTGSHDVSVPLTAPVKLADSERLVVFVGGMTGGSGGMTVSGALVSYGAQ
jgi:hypothetical protein